MKTKTVKKLKEELNANKVAELQAEIEKEKLDRATNATIEINEVLKKYNCDIFITRIEVEGQPAFFKKEIIAK